MNHSYCIHKITANGLLAVIYSLGYDSPMNHLCSIEGELKKYGSSGEVVFDLLLSNGNTSDRFYRAIFNGEHLVESSIKKIKNPSSEIQKESLSFYHHKQEYLLNSVLNKAQRFLIKKNHPLRLPRDKKAQQSHAR